MGDNDKDTKDTGGTGEGRIPPTSPGAASSGEAGTPKDDTPTLTTTQAQEIASKAVQDALTKAGRDAKTLEKERKELGEWQARKDAEELDRYKDDPEKMDVVKERQQLRKDKAAHAAEIKAANEAKLEITCFRLGQEHGVKAEDLKEAALKYNLTSEELIEDLASRMAKGEPGTPAGAKPPVKPPDSGKTIGGIGTGELTADQKLNKGFADKKK